MKIREVTPEDASAIAAIYSSYVTDTTISFETVPPTVQEMQRRIADFSADGRYFVCEAERRIAGYCYAHEWKERPAYHRTLETTIYLHPDFKGQGIGRKLMERLIEVCRRQEVHALIACITACNTESIAFHRSLGFEQVSLFKEVGCKFGKWLDVVDMELIIDKDKEHEKA